MSSKSKTDIDEISRETQRIVSDSYVRLPYHKPKQKSLKDFLNRQQKTSLDFQTSVTGSKKLLQKAWELLEIKEQNAERFYNEESKFIEDDDEQKSSLNNTMQNEDVINLDDDYRKKIEEYSDEENDSDSNETKPCDNQRSLNYDDSEEENYLSEIGSISDESHNDDDDDDDDNDENDLEKNPAKEFIDNEAESESDCDSEKEEGNLHDLIYDWDDDEEEENDEIDFSKKKKRRVIIESDEDDDDNDNKNNDNDNNSNEINENVDGYVNNIFDINLDTEIKLLPTDIVPLFNETQNNPSTQQLLDLCSGKFETQQSQTQEVDDDFEDDFDSEVPLSCNVNTFLSEDEESLELVSAANAKLSDDEESLNLVSVMNTNISDDEEPVKITSAKHFFDDEAELSESDWSSDDEEHMNDAVDKMEEEEGDKDKLDVDLVKDGLDKIYMRQLLDDDQQQVNALKEMLLEDGELHTESGRKRKFQWDEIDENDAFYKKPLFSDDENDDDDDAMSDNEKTEQWRKDRFKRESFLAQNNDDDDETHEIKELNPVLNKSFSVVKKTHVVRYQKCGSKNVSKIIDSEKSAEAEPPNDVTKDKCEEDNSSNTISEVTTETTALNEENSDLVQVDSQVINIAVNTLQSSKFLKGSFMKNNNKMALTLLNINKKSTATKKSEIKNEKDKMQSLNTVTAKASTNPFAYLLRNDTKPEVDNLNSDTIMIVSKKENTATLSNPSTPSQPTQQLHQIKSRKPNRSLLRELE